MPENEHKNKYWLHLLLFIATLLTTTLAGYDWIGIYRDDISWWETGLQFSLPFLLILTIHEFGHYITARIYKVAVSLPYYIPLYLPGMATIGTLGAFIRMKSQLRTKRMIFDIGIAGPLAGFVAAIGVLIYGFTHLPEPEYVFQIHEDYKDYGLGYEKAVYSYEYHRRQDSIGFEARQRMDSAAYADGNSSIINFLRYINMMPETWERQKFIPAEEYVVLATGKNLLFLFFEKYVVDDPRLIPNKYEMFHYPFLFAGYLALFFTALNLIPIGQLDGGHVVYGLFGEKKHRIISPIIFGIFVFFAGLGIFRNNILDINFFQASFENVVIFSFIYIYFLYLLFSKTFQNRKNSLMVAVLIFASQFFAEIIFPGVKGFNGWLLFAFLIGRVLGVYHPPAQVEEPLNTSRKILGWLCLIIFVLCFTPRIIAIETITP